MAEQFAQIDYMLTSERQYLNLFDIIQLEWFVAIFLHLVSDNQYQNLIWFECFVQIVYILSNGSREQNLRQIYRLLDDKQVVS